MTEQRVAGVLSVWIPVQVFFSRKVVENPYQLLEFGKLVGKDNQKVTDCDAVADALSKWWFPESKAEA